MPGAVSSRPLRAFVGTSGWIYGSWTGPFYPPEVKGTDKLVFYASRFRAVEVNATFYRLPTDTMAQAWNRRLPRGFHLVLKGSRAVTHMKKLVDCDRALEAFLRAALTMRRLRVVLWQLPPNLHRNVERLDRFLGELPRDVRYAVEFRHESWWDDSVMEVLRRHRAAFAAVSHPSLPDTLCSTTDFLYLRFHGLGPRLYDYDYSREELSLWVERVRHARERTVYAFFNNDINAHAPANAATLQEMLSSL